MEQRPRSGTGENMGWLFGAILIALGGVALANQFLNFNFNDLIWALVFGGVGAAFFSLSLRSPANWWAMIPGYVFAFVGAVIILGRLGVEGDGMGIFVLSAVGLPFLYVYIRDRRHWWALIPAYVMFAVSGIIVLSHYDVAGGLTGAYVMFAVAFPFFIVYLLNRANWWALIPAGIMSFIGVGIMVASFQYILPVALIGIGVAILLVQFGRNKNGSAPAELPKAGPEADKPRV
jgi:hypothetical protein